MLYKVHVKTNPILVAGSLKGYVGTVEDVTERERAHEIVQESELWFRNIADNAPVMIWSTDRELNFNYFNDRWLKYTGHTYEEEAGAEWINNVFEEDRKRVLNGLKIAAKKREPFRLEFRLKHNSGNYRWITTSGEPIYTPDNSFTGYIGCCIDIDEQVTIYQKLEKKVSERTYELTAALEREKELNNLKSRFISIASHEFRTPLSTILSSTGLIDQYLSLNQSENMPKHINRIKTSVKHLIDILNDFLSLDKLEQGKVDVEREEFDLQKFTAEIMSEFESILKPQQNIRFEYDGNTTVFLDKKIVHGILTNLLSNAVKYSEKDIELRVEVKQQQIKIMITDKGIGIPEEDQQHMFNKYFRATNVGNIKGTGLGLSIVQRYVELLKGTIDFSSTKSVGTTFRIQFPRTVMQNDTLFLFPLNV